jgi:hypothetical protein
MRPTRVQRRQLPSPNSPIFISASSVPSLWVRPQVYSGRREADCRYVINNPAVRFPSRVKVVGSDLEEDPFFSDGLPYILLQGRDLASGPVWHSACYPFPCLSHPEKPLRFVTMAHQLAWMEHPAIWLCETCAILWLVLRLVRSPLVRTGVLLMLCGLGMNALVTDSNAGSMPVVGMPPTVRPASPMWQGATLQTQLPLLADQAGLGLFSIGDIALLFGGILIVVICLRRTLERRGRKCRR